MAIYNHGLPIPRKKVESGGADTSADTVTPEVLVKDYTAHDAEGKPIVGELDLEEVRDEGYAEGQTAGYNSGYAEGHEAGKQTEYNDFWDSQLEGTTSSLVGYFSGRGWNAKTFKPNQSLHCSGSILNMFYCNGYNGDLVDLFESMGLEITFKNIVAINLAFNNTFFTRVPVIEFASGASIISAFANSYDLETIDGIVIDQTNTFSNAFTLCLKLRHITIMGTIGNNGFNVTWSPLDKTSLVSIMTALSTTTTGLTVTLNLNAVNDEFETSPGAKDGSTSPEWLELKASRSNWTVVLAKP